MKNLTEFYPLQDQYGGDGGPGKAGEITDTNNTLGSRRNAGRVLFEVNQELNSLDAIELFKTAEITALADRRAVVEAPKTLEFRNTGGSCVGVVIKIPIWTDDTTQSGSDHIQLLLGAGEEIRLPTSQIIKAANSSLNTGTEITSFTAPDSNMYLATGSGCTDLDNTTNPVTFTTVGARHRVGDLIRVENEILEVTAISGDSVTVKRASHGSTAASHTDGLNVNLAFFNTTRKFDNYSTACTDESGFYSATNFFGLGRSDSIANSGIVPGSACFKFYSEPSQKMGCTNLAPSSDSGLVSGEVYYIKVAANGGTAYEVVFTVDSTKMGGANGVLSKIQAILNTQFHTSSSALKGHRISVSLAGGDVKWTLHERKSGSTIALTEGTTGDTSHDMVANALGVFPASVQVAVATSLPNNTVYNSLTYQEEPNYGVLLRDNGLGQLVGGPGSGSINYETGALTIQAYNKADFVYTVSHSSGLAGRASSTGSNIIESVFAKCTNAKVKSSLRIRVRG